MRTRHFQESQAVDKFLNSFRLAVCLVLVSHQPDLTNGYKRFPLPFSLLLVTVGKMWQALKAFWLTAGFSFSL